MLRSSDKAMRCDAVLPQMRIVAKQNLVVNISSTAFASLSRAGQPRAPSLLAAYMRSAALLGLACCYLLWSEAVGPKLLAIWLLSLSVAALVNWAFMGGCSSSAAKDAAPPARAPPAPAPATPPRSPPRAAPEDAEVACLSPSLARPPSPPTLSPGVGASRPSREGSPFEGDKDAARTEFQAPALCFGEGSPARPRANSGDDAAAWAGKARKSSISQPDKDEAAKNVHALLAALGGLPEAPPAPAPARSPSKDARDAPALLGRGGVDGDDAAAPPPDAATAGLVSGALDGEDGAAAAQMLATHSTGIADGLRLLYKC